MKDSHKLGELGDIIFRIGHHYYSKGYYKEALEEFENALEVRKKLSVTVDIANTHRLLGETLIKLGENMDRAKLELSMYYSMTLRLNDLVEIQRALTTLGNYYMSLAENNYKNKRMDHLNEAYSHYLKSYDLLNEIWDRKLVDAKEFGLMKARTCLNCGKLY
jgi:tetratricopeptide (TPR) repeat protein